MKYKVAELEGAQLDAAVALADGGRFDRARPSSEMQMILAGGRLVLAGPQPQQLAHHQWSPSSDWAQGGPIIDREHINVEWGRDRGEPYDIWLADICGDRAGKFFEADGDTALIAAMRAYVASKFGEEVDLP
jgi:hypothetical protein